MANYNRVILAGNLVTDVQYKMLPSQTAVAEFRMAVNRKYKTSAGEQRVEAMFIDCTVFGAQADTIQKYCQKGKPLLVEGRLKYDTWEKDGQKRSKHSVVVDNFQFLGDGQGGAGGGDRQQDRAPQRQAAPQRAPGQRPQTPQQEPPFSDGDSHFADADVPFLWAGRRGPGV